MKSKEELKKLFENGDKPTQEEFWEWQDSYWHKDEKLPTEAAGIYKIKGSVANLAALNALTNMSEGDVYNLLDTGDNYVYVLDLNNTGVAGWDKLSGIIDLSTVNLQRVLNNGSYANTDVTDIIMDMNYQLFSVNYEDFPYPNEVIRTSVLNHTLGNTTISHNNIQTGSVSMDIMGASNSIRFISSGYGNPKVLTLNPVSALTYSGDYSPSFTDRSLVDKGYVDNATSSLNYLPLSGTEVDKPLTGNIALNYTKFISGSNGYNSRLDFEGDSSELYSITPMFRNSVRVSSDAVVLRSSNIASTGNYSEIYVREGLIRIATVEGGVRARGLTGDDDYTANITALDYVQKKYVDDATKRTKGEITTITNVGSGSVTGVVSYEHEENSDYFTVRLDIEGSLPNPGDSCFVTFPFEIGITNQTIIHNGVTLNVYTSDVYLSVQRISEENVPFNIKQCFIIPYGFEATSN